MTVNERFTGNNQPGESRVNDREYMKKALDMAWLAFSSEEVPVGAVIVAGGRIIAAAGNETRQRNSPIMHAEIIAIEEASRVFGNERLTGCQLFVTKEPCAMCSGAIVNARIERVVIAARDSRYGACGTVLTVCGNSLLNHRPVVEFGLLEDESSSLLKEFFRGRR